MLLRVLVVPNARHDEIVGWQAGALKLRLAAPPIEGRANEALCHFLAATFDLAPSTIAVVKGLASKHKSIELPLDREELDRLLTALGH